MSWSDHGGRFLAAVENGPLSATQFHPEKSGDAGIRLLQNWVHGLRSAYAEQTAARNGPPRCGHWCLWASPACWLAARSTPPESRQIGPFRPLRTGTAQRA